jgi:hypothetical protein
LSGLLDFRKMKTKVWADFSTSEKWKQKFERTSRLPKNQNKRFGRNFQLRSQTMNPPVCDCTHPDCSYDHRARMRYDDQGNLFPLCYHATHLIFRMLLPFVFPQVHAIHHWNNTSFNQQRCPVQCGDVELKVAERQNVERQIVEVTFCRCYNLYVEVT